MITRVQTTALVLIPLTTVAASLWLAGEPLSFTWFTSFGIAETITFATLAVFNFWIWKWRCLQGWFVKRPILEGKWRFVINSLWVNPTIGKPPNEITADVTISQTYTKLHLQLKTSESKGDFISAKIIEKDDGTYQIAGIFRNEPLIHLQDRSRTHIGALLLNVVGKSFKPKNLKGHYWTDRGTKGEIKGSRITSPSLDSNIC